MKSLALIGALLCINTSLCSARLGETLDQSTARYGTPLSVKGGDSIPGCLGDKVVVYQKGGFMITLIFFKGIVGAESIGKADGSDFSDNEQQNFLDADAASLQWTKTDTGDFSGTVWLRDDKAVARCDTLNHSFTFESKDYFDAAQAKKVADENDKMKGF